MMIWQLCAEAHEASRKAGWWDQERNQGEMIALMHSELSEALEAIRKPTRVVSDKPFWVKCRECEHCWPAAYLPMDAVKFAQIAKRAICPKCGDRRPVVAKQEDGVLKEPSP